MDGATRKDVCLVIGAGEGVGQAIAHRFAADGHPVCVTRRARNLAQLDDLELTREEKRDYEKRLRELRVHEGVTCSLEVAFDYHSRLYVYEMQPDWYDEFLSVEDEIMSLIADHEDMDDDEPLGGYFSKN